MPCVGAPPDKRFIIHWMSERDLVLFLRLFVLTEYRKNKQQGAAFSPAAIRGGHKA
jgi:hypothetical protein